MSDMMQLSLVLLGLLMLLCGGGWLFTMEWWPFHGGRLFVWPFKKRKGKWYMGSWSSMRRAPLSTWSTPLNQKVRQTSYHSPSVYIGGVDLSCYVKDVQITVDDSVSEADIKEHNELMKGLEPWSATITFDRRDTVTKGIYLNKNGKTHECDTPEFKWERGSQLPTVWKCPCGQEWSLVAELLSEYDKEGQKLNSLRGVITVKSYEERYDKLATYSKHRKKLTYADILKLGNKERTEERREFRGKWYDPLGTGPMFDYRTVSLSPEEIINDEVSFRWVKVDK